MQVDLNFLFKLQTRYKKCIWILWNRLDNMDMAFWYGYEIQIKKKRPSFFVYKVNIWESLRTKNNTNYLRLRNSEITKSIKLSF